MIEHGESFSVQVETPDLFYLIDKGRNSFVSMNRQELERYRNIIDQALNTSQDEIDASN